MSNILHFFNRITKKTTINYIYFICAIALLCIYFSISFSIKRTASDIVVPVTKIEQQEKIFVVDLNKICAIPWYLSWNERATVNVNKRIMLDRVQLIGQGLVKPDLIEIAEKDYLVSKRVFLLERGKIYLSLGNTNSLSDITFIKIRHLYVPAQTIFWVGIFILIVSLIPLLKKINNRKTFIIFLLLFFCAITSLILYKELTIIKFSDFESGNLVRDFLNPAFNICRYGTYTHALIKNEKEITYSNYREPMLSFLLTPFILALNNHGKDYSSFFSLESKKGFPILRTLPFVLLLALSVLSGFFVFDVTGSILLSILTVILISTSPTLVTASLGIRDTVLISLGILWCSVAFYYIFLKKTIVNSLSLGLSITFLYFSRASVIAILPIFLLLIIFDIISSEQCKKIKYYLLSFVIFLSITGFWSIRNYIRVGTMLMNSYGSAMGGIRVSYNDIVYDPDYLRGFIAWAPQVTPSAVGKFFGKNSRFYPLFKDSFRNMELKAESANLSPKDAVLKVISNPIRHLLASILLFYRGAFPEDYRGNKSNPLLFRSIVVLLFHLAAYIAIIWLILHSKNRAIIAFYVPCVSFLLLNCVCTHNIQRYNFPLVPILYISLTLLVGKIVSFISRNTALYKK